MPRIGKITWMLYTGALVSLGCAAQAPVVHPAQVSPVEKGDWHIGINGDEITIRAGMLERRIGIRRNNLVTQQLSVNGKNLLAGPGGEVSLTLYRASPNREPGGIEPGSPAAESLATFFELRGGSIAAGSRYDDVERGNPNAVGWVEPVALRGTDWGRRFGKVNVVRSTPQPGVTRLNVRRRADEQTAWQGVSVTMTYEIYDGYPVIRKWVTITNNGMDWLKIADLVVDDIQLAEAYRRPTPLTPSERGAGASVVAFGDELSATGVIAVSEAPSATRLIREDGGVGYNPTYFEWVIGPAESFTSEPAFLYAYDGPVERTLSGVSTPMARAVERPYQRFLRERLIRPEPVGFSSMVPLWCTWSNFASAIDAAVVREQANLAAQAGFATVQLDAGWAETDELQHWLVGGTTPDPKKFPDFSATARYVKDKGLHFGVWVSTYRNPNYSKDFEALPEAASVPTLHRSTPPLQRGGNPEGDGVAMSFSGPWRRYYANDLVRLRDVYGVRYVKQDLSSIQFGDIARGHESRTIRESLLRSLRGLLSAQDLIHEQAPDVTLQISHEVYWGTPGAPADMAVLKHADLFHIPRNDLSGIVRMRPVEAFWKVNADSLRGALYAGAYNARTRLFAHRGLPLDRLEYYAAATVNVNGSLTPQVQDRQVASWLMGRPQVYAGDLSSLTPENIRVYRQRFDEIRRLHREYGIYHYFQYSGVPEPTDTDWHWWGKLNDDGYGAVVVLRGSEGAGRRAINIPWVAAERRYAVTGLLSGKRFGTLTGAALRKGALDLALPTMSQEILELAPAE